MLTGLSIPGFEILFLDHAVVSMLLKGFVFAKTNNLSTRMNDWPPTLQTLISVDQTCMRLPENEFRKK